MTQEQNFMRKGEFNEKIEFKKTKILDFSRSYNSVIRSGRQKILVRVLEMVESFDILEILWVFVLHDFSPKQEKNISRF